ncbi:hypothetical protein [Allonocardiopsis opalescens]|uniref:Uncharacterized protein n=1 Tax=Allonocardiopsis opalescens TaxID=1144618 RepID=A0A2T0PXA3_9ACTN|nr:hypothetical protein [Allonocardiopsis opalescens]PRX96165.1 hypothetical protein CLV72_108171 [Allonocardiopsis opalescens]
MSDSARSAPPPPPLSPPVPRRHGFLIALRVAVGAHAAMVLLQAASAGGLLSGADGMWAVHGAGAGAVHVLGLVQLVAAVLYWRPGGGPPWPAWASLALLLLGMAQSAVGGSGAVAVHVPLGVAVFGLTVWMLTWAMAARRAAVPA